MLKLGGVILGYGYRRFTTGTRLMLDEEKQKPLDNDIALWQSAYRHVIKLLQTWSKGDSKLNSYIQGKFGVDKRTANSIIKEAVGRRRMQFALYEYQIEALGDKVSGLRKSCDSVLAKINGFKTRLDDLTDSEWKKYKNLKHSLYHKRNRINKYSNTIKRLEDRVSKRKVGVCFGTRELFKKQYNLKQNGYSSHDDWYRDFRLKRDSFIGYVGSKDETRRNQNCRLSYDGDMFNLKLKKVTGLSGKKGDVNNCISFDGLDFKYVGLKRDLIYALRPDCLDPFPLTYKIVRRLHKGYVKYHLKVTVTKDLWQPRISERNGCIGIDYNTDRLALAEVDYYGNLTDTLVVSLKYRGSNARAESEIFEKVAEVVSTAKQNGQGIVIENLDFVKTKAKYSGNKKYNKMLHQFDYSRFRKAMESVCYRSQVPLREVNPYYTTKIGDQKYRDRMKLNGHVAAAYVIGGKGLGYEDRYVEYVG